MDEHRLRSVAASSLKQVQGADSVNVEVVEWPTGGEVVTGLGGRVDDQSRPDVRERLQYLAPLSDVERDLQAGQGAGRGLGHGR